MLKKFEMAPNRDLEDWYLHFPPAQVTVHDLKTGKQVQEPSLVAVSRRAVDKVAGFGTQARDHEGQPGMVVFSPFRQGQTSTTPRLRR